MGILQKVKNLAPRIFAKEQYYISNFKWVQLISIAIDDINYRWKKPKGYNLETLPEELQSIAILGAISYALVFEEMKVKLEQKEDKRLFNASKTQSRLYISKLKVIGDKE